ncbi:hypothetical protein ACGWZA_000256 [Enterococcus hirae]|uniref:hypothetical protein n=1 Tax=Enterococcus sp. C57 TaxID=3231318 RepID=UPI002116EC62|nr:hypothetical protein [Enterococcus hirae]
MIKALQQCLGVKPDGLFGQDMIQEVQRYLEITQDGVISPVSDTVKELQRRLNANKL